VHLWQWKAQRQPGNKNDDHLREGGRPGSSSAHPRKLKPDVWQLDPLRTRRAILGKEYELAHKICAMVVSHRAALTSFLAEIEEEVKASAIA